jgi:ketosteroid isomerase-like protein
MEPVYEINVAKTEFREAYNTGDVARLLAVFHDDAVNMSEAIPSRFGRAVKKDLAERASDLFARFSVRLVPIVYGIVPCGDKMFDYGWHEFTLTPKTGGAPVRTRQRYMELWSKDAAGQWKISFHMNNVDIRAELNGVLASWFADQPSLTSAT